MRNLLYLLICILLPTLNLFAQTDEIANVEKVILELFDGYRAGDSARVGNTFDKNAVIQTISKDIIGVAKLSEGRPAQIFMDYIGGGLKELHDEKLWDTKIMADEMLATVYTNYAFFLGEKFSHCGTETFLLRKVNNEWKIFYLVDTRQTSGCKLPDKLK